VSVQMSDGGRCNASLIKRHAHRSRGTVAAFRSGSQMVSVGGCAVSDQFAKNRRSSHFGVLGFSPPEETTTSSSTLPDVASFSRLFFIASRNSRRWCTRATARVNSLAETGSAAIAKRRGSLTGFRDSLLGNEASATETSGVRRCKLGGCRRCETVQFAAAQKTRVCCLRMESPTCGW
jgi:hypothetical protein